MKRKSFILFDKYKNISCLGISYNQPKFAESAHWNQDGITFATSSTVGYYPRGIFINTKNTIYVADQYNGRIQIWLNDTVNVSQTISDNLSTPYSLFVTANDDIYIDNSYLSNRIDKRVLDTNFSDITMYVRNKCYGLFIDINDNLYCSIYSLHQVVMKSLNSVSNMLTVVAGSTCYGSQSNMLNSPWGIFVDVNIDLYVADCGNNRIQLFSSDQLDGRTVAGSTAAGTITLSCPSGIVLDADKYLFIVDMNNHRIVRSGPDGFRCLIGCYGTGSSSNLLQYPTSMAFDRYGNIFVTDTDYSRIQKISYIKRYYP